VTAVKDGSEISENSLRKRKEKKGSSEGWKGEREIAKGNSSLSGGGVVIVGMRNRTKKFDWRGGFGGAEEVQKRFVREGGEGGGGAVNFTAETLNVGKTPCRLKGGWRGAVFRVGSGHPSCYRRKLKNSSMRKGGEMGEGAELLFLKKDSRKKLSR